MDSGDRGFILLERRIEVQAREALGDQGVGILIFENTGQDLVELLLGIANFP